MATSHRLQISPSPAAGVPLSPEQQRFNALIGQIGQVRETLAAWQAQIPLYHLAHVKRIQPLIEKLRQARRHAVFVLDGLCDQPGWTRAEAATLRELIVDRAGESIAGGSEPDPSMQSLLDKHGVLDPGPADDSDEDAGWTKRLQAELAAQLAAGQARAAAKATAQAARRGGGGGEPGDKKGGVRSRRNAQALQATQSVREVYRRLASEWHPDREPDATQRDAKTALMQRVNSAYAARDLLALLELQLDARRIQGATEQRLTHYNQVLAEQLRELKLEVERVQSQFELDFGIDAPGPLNPMKLGRLVDEGYRELSAVLAESRREARTLTDRAATKKWLKQVRIECRESAMDDEFS